jgi:uncharacterized protein
MGRPQRTRTVEFLPRSVFFKPAGVPARELEHIVVQVDEIEALRLTDLLGLSQEQAAERLGVSRQTVGRVLDAARSKVTDALVNGKALAIEGGAYHVVQPLFCGRCGHRWMSPADRDGRSDDTDGSTVEERCPACGSEAVALCAPPECEGEAAKGQGRGRGPRCCGPGRGGAGRFASTEE